MYNRSKGVKEAQEKNYATITCGNLLYNLSSQAVIWVDKVDDTDTLRWLPSWLILEFKKVHFTYRQRTRICTSTLSYADCFTRASGIRLRFFIFQIAELYVGDAWEREKKGWSNKHYEWRYVFELLYKCDYFAGRRSPKGSLLWRSFFFLSFLLLILVS